MRKITVIIALFLAAIQIVSAQKVGLVLSGGGAKGAAHIGVIKALEENNIETTLTSEETKIEPASPKVSEVELYLSKMDPLNMSPMEALSTLMELKKMVEGRS